jgi:predicted naringenin-chalcone synthase
MMMMSIAGIGTALPPHRIDQADAAEIAAHYTCETPRQEWRLKGMYRLAGVETRHSVVLDASDGDLGTRQSFYSHANPSTCDRMREFENHAGALAVSAGRKALQQADAVPEQVTHVITVSCSGFYAPGFDIALIKNLGLPARVARTHIGFMGCHGLLNGLRVARAFVAADPRACVLLCAVEMCSLHHQYGWDSDQIVANALFADGAAALVGVSSGRLSKSIYHVVATGSALIDDCEDAMTWRIRDHGFQMTLSPRVPELITRTIRPYLDAWLAELGLSLSTIGSWAVHPGGPRILSAFGEATGLDRAMLETSQSILTDYGNMSSPTVLFILDRLSRIGAPRPCVALAFGPGLAVESALLE